LVPDVSLAPAIKNSPPAVPENPNAMCISHPICGAAA